MQDIKAYKAAFAAHLDHRIKTGEPAGLYAPIHYIMGLGGKRLRPVLALMAAEAFGADYKKALDAALAVEVFHNFSLVHDDIMDDAPLRRGRPTVHEKWDANTGILSGDAMLLLSYRMLEGYGDPVFKRLTVLLGDTALKVCEGQQYDMDFESRTNVSLGQYLKMIRYKTAVLVAAALKMGAIVADAPVRQQEDIYDFGLNLGLAFQLQDDYLDAFGDPQRFGKRLGGDIKANKKTFLYLKAMELADPDDARHLSDLYGQRPADASVKIGTATRIFEKSGAAHALRQAVGDYTDRAFTALVALGLAHPAHTAFAAFAQNLMGRTQ